MHAAGAETLALVALAAALLVAVLRPARISEAVVAVPAAALLVGIGVEPWHDARHQLASIGPTVAFLAAILVFGHLCAAAGVFDDLAARAARASRGRPRRLLLLVVVLAALVTAVLTLDATVVLVTPVVLATVTRLGVPARPPAYACVRLANSASLLLPVSNLTNLLAFGIVRHSELSFGRFAGLMLLPWLLAGTCEWAALRLRFGADLRSAPTPEPATRQKAPRYALTVLALTVAGFVVTSSLHVAPAWAALGGCLLLLAGPGGELRRHRPLPLARRLVGEASIGFCLFVLALAVLVDAVTRHGLGTALAHLLPSGDGLLALLAVAFLAAGVANVVNNLPATLALVPLVAGSPALLLAVLLGVNIGPNATYAGSLATLLWRRLLPAQERPRAREFHAFGLLSVPITLAVTTCGLWLGVRVWGA